MTFNFVLHSNFKKKCLYVLAAVDADHLLFSNRSHAFASLDRYQEALQDAEKVASMRPDWPKGFFRKGAALYGLGHYEDSVIAFLQCLTLDKEVTSARDFLSKVRENFFIFLNNRK
jgi:stress-induced-phosphoprotein 1